MSRALPTSLAGLLAVALALATRWPADTWTMGLSAACAAGTLLTGILASHGVARPWTSPLALLFGAGLLLTPAGPSPSISLPALVVVLPMLAYFHLLLRKEAHAVPSLSQGPSQRSRTLVRLLPWALTAAAVAAAPLLATYLLPDRLALAAELQGPGGPIIAAALAASLILAFAMALRALHRQPTPDDPGGPN